MNSPVLNFGDVDARVKRGGQPQDLAQWVWLKEEANVGAVAKLNPDDGYEGMPDDLCLTLGMEMFKDPISTTEQILTEPDLQFLIDIIDYIVTTAARGIVVFIHCWHGQDRTGLVVALYRIATGWTVEAAWAEALAHDYHKLLLGLDKAFFDLAKQFAERYASTHQRA